MAWKLRQFFEGDTKLTIEAPTSGACWISGSSYVTNSIALLVNGVEYLLPTVGIGIGILNITVPSSILIKGNTTIKAYAVCETDPESETLTLTAKPVNFSVYNSAITVCNPQTILIPYVAEYIRLFFTTTAGDYFNLKLSGTNMAVSQFSPQQGDTSNVTSTSGNFSRPGVATENTSLISNNSYNGGISLLVTPLSLKYFVVRLGWMEVVFGEGDLFYINYMVAGDEGTFSTYSVSDVIEIVIDNSNNYVVKKNGAVLLTKPRTVTYTPSSGTIVPSSSTLATPVAWNLPSTAGTYTVAATLGDSIKFNNSIVVHSCANAINDNFTGTINTPYVGNVSTNDVICTGENNYLDVTGSPVGGSVVLADNGAFTFTPTTGFNGTASFSYTRKCGASEGAAELIATATANINYYNACTGVVASWVSTGAVRCNNCTEEREERDVNSQCTSNVNRWVTNTGGGACITAPNLTPTGLTRCQNCVNEREVQDLNICSSTYQAKSWVVNPSGVNCDVAPNWVDNGNFGCVNCIEKKQQIDNKACSPTYNTTRFIDNPGGTNCNKTANWVDLDEFSCINCVEYKKQKDVTPCSPTFNLTRDVINTSGDYCDVNAIWVDTGLTRCNNGVHEKEQISGNACSEETERWIPSGAASCGCIVQIKINNKCDDGDYITGVEVYKSGVIEGNRLISFTNTVINFEADLGVFNYYARITYNSTMKHIIKYNNYNCNPTI